jgi:hypothetical protein
MASTSGGVRFFKIGFRRVPFLQRQFSACIIELFEAIETVAAVAHHFARLANVAELLGQLEQPYPWRPFRLFGTAGF